MIPTEGAMQQYGSGGLRSRSIYANSQGAAMPCSCSLFHDVDCGPGSVSLYFASSSAIEEQPPEDRDPHSGSYPSSVDCTLSLGTPSTRQRTHTTAKASPLSMFKNRHRTNTTLPWDLAASQRKQTPATGSVGVATSILGIGGGGGSLKVGSGDHLLARRCANCDTTSTPLWRNGPRGPKSLCNACGIRYKKEERRAGSTLTGTLPSTPSCSSSSSTVTSTPSLNMEPQFVLHHHQQQPLTGYDYYQSPWCYATTLQATARKTVTTRTRSLISAIDEGNTVDGAATNLPYLPWRFNHAAEFVPGLVHDYS